MIAWLESAVHIVRRYRQLALHASGAAPASRLITLKVRVRTAGNAYHLVIGRIATRHWDSLIDMEDFSTTRIEFTGQLDPTAYALAVYGCWGALVAGGYAAHSTIHTDSSVTDQQLDDVLERLIAESPWGW